MPGPGWNGAAEPRQGCRVGSRFRHLRLSSINEYRRLTCLRWYHHTGFWWSCTFDPTIYFLIETEDAGRSRCGTWERCVLENSQDWCWINAGARCWFVENDNPIFYSIADDDAGAGAAEPSSEAFNVSDCEWTTTVKRALSVERIRLNIMVFADNLNLRKANRVMCAWQDISKWKWQALHFRAAAARLQPSGNSH